MGRARREATQPGQILRAWGLPLTVWSGVCPFEFFFLASAPARTRISTQDLKPLMHARCRGVSPLVLAAFTLASYDFFSNTWESSRQSSMEPRLCLALLPHALIPAGRLSADASARSSPFFPALPSAGQSIRTLSSCSRPRPAAARDTKLIQVNASKSGREGWIKTRRASILVSWGSEGTGACLLQGENSREYGTFRKHAQEPGPNALADRYHLRTV